MTEQQTTPQQTPPQQTTPSPAPQWGVTGEIEAAGDATLLQPPPKRSLKDRRALRAVARWTLAVLVCGGLGAGAAYRITSMERTDVPGLATQDDGRWEYPKLKLPALPPGKPRPFNESNAGGLHHAALTDLMLPAPEGATADSGTKVLKQKDFAALYVERVREDVADGLRDLGAREVLSRSWTAADGTKSRIYLVRFPSAGHVKAFEGEVIRTGTDTELVGIDGTAFDTDWTHGPSDTGVSVVLKERDGGDSRVAFHFAGDTLALIVQSKKGGAERVPFHQTVALQAQLLN
ncbi:hypothetical protein [Streptomyces sp. KLOTTS4A1]|uniref:hypothetical protein n=1 Tax=Streptomyces sp. KLOTTS4A1 TaxID=3390996 RepID=UPI0039F642D2